MIDLRHIYESCTVRWFFIGLVMIVGQNPLNTFPQGEFLNWYFGGHGALKFHTGTPVAVAGCALNTGAVTSSISDSLGNLLFYTDGFRLYDHNNQLMPNGNFIYGNNGSFGQSTLAVRSIENDKIYYLFKAGIYQDYISNWIPATYSVIDMNLNGGLGDIAPQNKEILMPFGSHAITMVTGTRCHNNRDAWILFRIMRPDSNYYAVFRFSTTGLDPMPVLSPSTKSIPPYNPFFPNTGEAKFSPDGKKLFCYFNDTLEVCNFNSQTGVVTPLFKYRVRYNGLPVIYHQVEFSTNSKFVYIAGTPTGMSHVYQADALSTDTTRFTTSMTEVGTISNSHSALQMGPDWKIYGTRDAIDTLWVINAPDVAGAGCDFHVNGVCYYPGWHADGLPQFVQSYKAYIHHDGHCQRDTVNFSGDIWPPADTIRWDFGDPASGIANNSTLANPVHIYSDTGDYLVTLYVRHIDMRTDTSWFTLHVDPSPLPLLGPDLTICNGDSVTFDAGACPGCSYIWDNISSGQTNIGHTQTYTAMEAGIYRVTVTGLNGCSGWDTVALSVTTQPVITTSPLFKEICSGQSTSIGLSSNVQNVMFYWTAGLTSGMITGFTPDSGLTINQTLVNHLPTPGVVTYSIHAGLGSCISDTVPFAVTILPSDTLHAAITASATDICTGTPVTFTCTASGTMATVNYQWKVNNVFTGSNNPVFAFTPVDGDSVRCIVTSTGTGCLTNNPAVSNMITVHVLPILPVSISVTASANIVCAGTPLTFSCTATHGGSTPSFQWMVNGINAGTNNPVFVYSPVNNDVVTCSLLSSETCASGNPALSNPITMVVNANLPAGITITASKNPACPGESVSFFGAATHGGSTPSFQWMVNGINAGTNNPVFVHSPVNNDVIICSLLSSETCASGNPALSNPITMVVNANLPAGITITASKNPACPGESVSFFGAATHGGSTPVYQWMVNGINTGTNNPIFAYIPASADLVTCIMTSNLSCVTGNPATSNTIVMALLDSPHVTFTPCFDTITIVNAKPFHLKGGLPIGGTYSGPGVNSSTGIFTPSAAGIGVKTINYSFINVHDCGASKSKSIVVQPYPSFTCGNNLVDTRDNKVYPTVQIGTQCWMQTNLEYGTTISDNIPQTDNCIAEKYQSSFGNRKSYMYQWDEMMKFDDTPAGQGLCPPGWHVPTESEWATLMNYYQGNSRAGRPLQDTIINGFKALRSGVFYLNSNWSFLDFTTILWSSTASGQSKAISHGMNLYNYSVALYPASRANAFGVRCLRD